MRKRIRVLFLSILTLISPKLNTKFLYRRYFGRKLDLNNPKTSNEKVLWLKLNTYYRNTLVAQCADKYRVREYVQQCGCGEILNELYGVYRSADEIDFDTLPSNFVLKCNYGYSMNLVCKDKAELDVRQTKRLLKSWLRSKQHLVKSEIHYGGIPKRIICERFIKTKHGGAPDDYKIYCCNGKPCYVMVCIGRDKGCTKFYYFDLEGNIQRNMTGDGMNAPVDFNYEIPQGWDDMIKYAEVLSKPFPFVRADFYLEDGKVIFGELTFTPAAGLDSEKLPYTDKLLGDLINLHKQGNE